MPQNLGDWHRCGHVKFGRVNSDVLFRWFVAAHFGGGSLPAYHVVSLLMFQELISETSVKS